MPNFKKEIGKAKHFYFNIWRGNEKPCPAFDGEVVKVTRAGWNHILFLPRRNEKEIFGRLNCFKEAKHVLECSTNIVDYRKRGITEYWGIEDWVGKKLVRVVIRSVHGKEKHVFSIILIATKK